MRHFLLAVLLFISCLSVAFSQKKWNYKNFTAWEGDCKSEIRQSPIDIKSADAVYDKDLGNFTLVNYNKKLLDLNFTISNDGHSLAVVLDGSKYNVSGGGLEGTYQTVQLHLHWGSEDKKGSEHTLDEKQYAAEIHFVSYNTKYASLSEAKKKTDGLAVLGTFVEVAGDDNPAWSFLNFAKEVVKYDTSVVKAASEFAAFSEILPSDKTKYYRYNGSLTTPGCNEVVTWTVFKDAVQISQGQIGLLRSLKQADNSLLVDNFRPVMALNKRTVKASFEGQETTKPTGPTEGSTTKSTVHAGATVSRMTTGLFLSMLSFVFVLL